MALTGLKLHLKFHKSYNEDSDKRYFIDANVEFSEKSHNLHNDNEKMLFTQGI